MKAKPIEKWRDYNVSARDLVSDSNIVASFNCVGCRRWVEFNAWKIGAVLAPIFLCILTSQAGNTPVDR